MQKIKVSELEELFKDVPSFCSWEEFLKLKEVQNLKAVLSGKSKVALVEGKYSYNTR